MKLLHRFVPRFVHFWSGHLVDGSGFSPHLFVPSFFVLSLPLSLARLEPKPNTNQNPCVCVYYILYITYRLIWTTDCSMINRERWERFDIVKTNKANVRKRRTLLISARKQEVHSFKRKDLAEDAITGDLTPHKVTPYDRPLYRHVLV